MAIAHDLVRELLFFILLYGFDLGTDISVLFEAQQSYTAYKSFLEHFNDTRNRNASKQIPFCSSGPWDKDDYKIEIKVFGVTLVAMKFFTVLACFLIFSYLIAYTVLIIHRLITNSDPEENQSDKYVTVKFVFAFVCSMLQDIPLTCLAVDLYVKRSGSHGLTCWACYHDETCADKYILGKRFKHTTTLLSVSLTAAVIVSLCKGLTTFYRWSKVDNCRCYELRACVSIFVGGCFALVIMTPCLGILKFSFFTLPSESANVFSGITDRLFMMGIIIWGVFIVVAFCCPLLRCIQQRQQRA